MSVLLLPDLTEAIQKCFIIKKKNTSVEIMFQITAQCAPINVSSVDKMASNGVLHELQSVMIPPAGNIVQAAVACPAFKTLVAAVKAAGLVGVLSGQCEIRAICLLFFFSFSFVFSKDRLFRLALVLLLSG